MNPQWNTPPDGDFARYVEQLSARSAVARAPVPHAGEHGLDVGMPPTGAPGAQGNVAVASGAQRREPAPSNGAEALDPTMKKVLMGVGAVVLLALWASGLPFPFVVLLLGAGFWLAKQLKGLNLGTGPAKWQRVLEEAARRQREIQQQKQGK